MGLVPFTLEDTSERVVRLAGLADLGGYFPLGSSVLVATATILTGQASSTYPFLTWNLGGSFWTNSGLVSAGSDLAINGIDATLIDVLTTGWYDATCYAGGGATSADVLAFELLMGFESGLLAPYWGDQYQGLPDAANDNAQTTATSGPMYVTAGKQFSAFVGAILSDAMETWSCGVAGVKIVRLA